MQKFQQIVVDFNALSTGIVIISGNALNSAHPNKTGPQSMTDKSLSSCILVINCGSSSIKFSVIQPLSGQTIANGLAERLGNKDASIKIKTNAKQTSLTIAQPFDHHQAIIQLVNLLADFQLMSSITAIGHRVVHGGESYSAPTLITEDVKLAIKNLSKLAPLHNPANLTGIEATQAAFPTLQHVAIFDTAFHQTMPEKAFLYGLPYKLYKKHSIRKYGFHGTSHYYVSRQAAKAISKDYHQCSFISAHLGNGCSVTAIRNGESIDTSLGLTPLAGVMMGTRSGSIDPGIIFHLEQQLGYSTTKVSQLLNKESGLLGLSELSNDCRTLENAALNEDNDQAKLALEVFCYDIAKAIAGFSASLTQLDGIIFTGGIGENSSYVRQRIIEQLSLLGCQLDETANEQARFGQSGRISAPQATACWVIPTNEEWVIAEQTHQLLTQLN